MSLISEFVKEQKRYTRNELKNIFQFSNDEIDDFIRKLKSYGILKVVVNSSEQKELSDLIDSDLEVTDIDYGMEKYLYVFTYVGIVTVGNRVIKCYPKYIHEEDNVLEKLKKVIKVINKYGSKEQILNMMNGNSEQESYNVLAVMIFFLHDYHNYGLYNNTEDIIEIDGPGDILWDKTVNDGFSIIYNERPYYTELFTRRTIDDDSDYFKKLHEYILTECSSQLKVNGLLDLFDLVPVELSENNLEYFGDIDFILYSLQSEINIQYNSRKISLLKTIYTYIAQKKTIEDTFSLSMFGTNNFNLIWEDVCSEIFDNQLHKPISMIDRLNIINDKYNRKIRLIDLIKCPVWTGYKDDGSNFIKESVDTLIPDIVNIGIINNSKYKFTIMDSKYYVIQLEEDKIIRGQPGISDISKQYMYQLAYKEFCDVNKINIIENYFLLPSDKNDLLKKGSVKMDIMSTIGLKDIEIILVPAELAYAHYLNQNIIELSFG